MQTGEFMNFKGIAFAAAAALPSTTAAHAQAPAAKPLGLDLKPCILPSVGGQLRCGTFTVPENRTVKGGRTLSLKVMVIPARSAAPKEPIFILSGGPGQAATDQTTGLAGHPERATHDIVMMDLRGTGEGTRLDCRFEVSDLQAFVEPLFSESVSFSACRAELEKRADLTQYTTPIAMQDLDELRRAMGYGKVLLWGGSYGSRAGQVYIRQYGANVRAAFLTGISPLENRAPLHHAAAAQRAFDRTVEQCHADPAFGTAYLDPRGDLDAVRATLRRTPARVQVKHPVTGAQGEITLSERAFGDAVRVMLYSEQSGRALPLLLKRARAGDLAPFAQAAVQSGHGFRNGLVMGLLLSVTCPEDLARIRPEEIEAATAGTFTGDHRVRGQLAACRQWPETTMPASYFEPSISDVPVVLVSGDLDPVTPPQWGEVMKRSFTNSVHVVVPGAHGSDNDCVELIGHHLFETGSVQGLDTSCVATLKTPPFVLPSDGAAAGQGR